jgi:hypothetical protein
MALVLAATPVLFPSISIPPGMTLAVLSGILVSLQYLFMPPSVLFLASSAPGIEASFNALRRAAEPDQLRQAGLLRGAQLVVPAAHQADSRPLARRPEPAYNGLADGAGRRRDA